MDENIYNIVKNIFNKIEDSFSEYATKSCCAIRLEESDSDFRGPYSKDVDKIIHSFSYSRYLDKTQVYSYSNNDHISRRMIHVQLVSKIARTIGRALCLNTDLIEAISLGHDIGHTPLGHTGEKILNEISLEYTNKYFAHNVHGVRHFMYVEGAGEGLNLTVQTLDGIMCHNGEILSNIYKPISKDKNEFLREFSLAYTDINKFNSYAPMTLEGCVVRISDVIAYIGRDIEDAIILGLINRSDIPNSVREVLGDNNKDIVNNLINDIIVNSLDKPYIKMSSSVYEALDELKEFNYKNIYNKSMSNEEYNYYRDGMYKIFRRYLNDLNNNNYKSIIYKIFLDYQSDIYNSTNTNEEKVIDFIAGMTDDFFIKEVGDD